MIHNVMLKKLGLSTTKSIHYMINPKCISRPISLWSRVLIMKINDDIIQPSEQPNPCMGYSYYLPLHHLRQVLDLHHGHPVRQMDKVCMDVLKHLFRIHTQYIITYSPSKMLRETVQSSRTNICMYMTNISVCHHPKTCFFISLYQKIQKNLNNPKTK